MGGQGTVYLAQDHGATQNHHSASKDQPQTSEPSREESREESNEAYREVVLKEFLLPVFPDTRVRKAAAIKFQEEADLLGKLEHPSQGAFNHFSDCGNFHASVRAKDYDWFLLLIRRHGQDGVEH